MSKSIFLLLFVPLVWSCSASPSGPGGQATSATSSGTSSGPSTGSGSGGASVAGSTTVGGTTTGAGGDVVAGGAGGATGTTGGDASAGGTGGSPPRPDGGPPPGDPSARVKFNFNLGWKFIKQDVTGAQAQAFDDASWASVSTPHTFNDTDTYVQLGPANMDGEKSMFTGRTWYRKHFTLPAEYANRKVFIEFEGVRQRGRVYVNGVDVGMSESGFVPFGFDLTANLKFGADNVIAVLCDNTFPMNAEGSTNPLTWHDSHWHPNFGGIYRNVYLHVMDKVHVTLPLYSNLQTSGVYGRATNVTTAAALVAVDAEVANEDAAAKTIDWTARLVDAQGAEALVLTDQQPVPAGGKVVFKKTGMLMAPKVWEPASPHVYKLEVTLKSGGAILDVTTVPFGVRSWKFDSTSGFTINGKHVKLHGWAQKPSQSWAGLGAAMPEWMHDYTMRMQKAANSNFMRWAHCAGSPGNVDFSDKYGIVVMQPGVDAEGDNVGAAWTTRTNAFRSVITYFRNNPSILIWEGGNQATFTGATHVSEMRQIATQLDPSRTFTFRRLSPALAQYVDISIGTEGGNDAPSLPVVEGENGRWESPRRVWDALSPPSFGYNVPANMMTPGYAKDSEQFAVAQVSDWALLRAAGHAGGANLHFTDEPTHRRVYAEVARATGEVDANRLPKEAYFTSRAMWSEQPQVHIVGHWNYTATTTKDVNVVSNCDAVELFVNGTSLGRNATPTDTHLFVFRAVRWAAGTIRAVGYRGTAMAAEQEKKTAGDPFQLRLTATTGPDGFRADGADAAIIDVEVLDKDGNRCPTDQARVDFTMSGPGVWRGGYNSGKANSTNNTYLDTECGINRVFVRSTATAGAVTVNATRAGLTPATVKIDSVPVQVVGGLSRTMPAVYTTAP